MIAAGLFLVSWCRFFGKASALLQLDQVPNRITNERSATFTYVCTPLDVADKDGCDVEVRESEVILYDFANLPLWVTTNTSRE